MIGQTVGGRYAIVRLLGEGGMGAVYEARHTGTGRRVAVKVITGALARDARLVSRFEREARAAGAIESEHIVQVLDVGVDEPSGVPFLAMELLVGEDLDQLLGRLGPVPAEVALRIGVQACLGLEKAHAAGIVHRDVKPANLFLAERDSGERLIKVLDFGIAKVSDGEAPADAKKRQLTQTGAILGSPLYMSPEQSRSKGRLDHRTDLWSLGVVLYQAISGRTPQEDAESLGDFIVAVCTTPSAPLRQFAPWVDPMVANAVEKALAIDPEGRYQSAAEMREALSVFLPQGATLRGSMLVRAPEAGPAPPPREEPPPAGAAVPATPAAMAVAPIVGDAGDPPVAATPSPSPSFTPSPSPAMLSTVPGEPIPAAFTPATPLSTGTVPTPPPGAAGLAATLLATPGSTETPDRGRPPSPAPAAPPPPAPRRDRRWLYAGLLVVAAGGGIGAVRGLGGPGEGTTATAMPVIEVPTPPPETSGRPAPAPPTDLTPLTGAWWGDAGIAYDAVVVGETVELRVRDPDPLAGEGYTAGEAVFVLRPIGAEPHAFEVEAPIRPAPPRGTIYDRARAGGSCVASWSRAGGKQLRAVHAIDRLVIQTVKVDPAPAVFAREGFRVVSCAGLAEARVVEAEIVLGRTPTAAPPRWVVRDAGAHEAGVHEAGNHDAGVADAGAHAPAVGHDAGTHDAGSLLPSGKGFGAPCYADAQCASRHCVATMCR